MVKSLFLVDYKHKQVLASMPIKDVDEAHRIIGFLDRNHITSRYETLLIAENVTEVFDDGERVDLFVEE